MSTWLITLQALLSHWRRHRLQAVAIFTGLWLATALWTGVQALNAQARSDYARASAVLSSSTQARLVARDGQRLDQSLYVQLRRLGWDVTPLLEGRVNVAGPSPHELRVIGIEPLSQPGDARVAGQPLQDFDVQGFINAPGQTLIAPDTWQALGLRTGEVAHDLQGRALPPFRLEPDLAPGVLVMDIGQAQALLQAPGQFSRLLINASGPPLPEPLARRVSLQPGDDDGDLGRLTDSFHLNLTALGLLAFVVGLFIAHAAIGLALEQRRALLRTVRACGVSQRVLLLGLTLELGVFAVVGGIAGVASGYGLAALLLPDVAASVQGLYGAHVSRQLSLPAQWWLSGVGVAVLGALLAGASSVARAARLPLLALARPQAWRLAQLPWLKRQALVAVDLALVALACWRYGHGLPSAFALVAAVLLAAALLLPLLLEICLAGLARLARRPLSQWFVADSRQQLPALSLALMALLLALAASVGVGSMTEGFRGTFLGWLDQRLSADLYISPQDTAQATRLADWLTQRPEVTSVVASWRTDVQVQGWPVQAQGVAEPARLREHWPLLSGDQNAWSRLAKGEGVMLSEQLARRLEVTIGSTLALGAERPFAVVGIYADYGNPKGHLLLDAEALRSLWPQARLTSLGVQTLPGQASTLRSAVQATFALDQDHLIEQAALKRWSTEIFSRTFAATAALNSLTLGIAAVALFISLLTLGQTRLGQLAPLWALGVRRAHLVWLSLGQTVLLGGLTVALAIPLGLLLAWCLVAVVNVQAFGWRLPLSVFPDQLLRLAFMGLLSSVLASAWPLWQLARRQPNELLRSFADEQ